MGESTRTARATASATRGRGAPRRTRASRGSATTLCDGPGRAAGVGGAPSTSARPLSRVGLRSRAEELQPLHRRFGFRAVRAAHAGSESGATVGSCVACLVPAQDEAPRPDDGGAGRSPALDGAPPGLLGSSTHASDRLADACRARAPAPLGALRLAAPPCPPANGRSSAASALRPSGVAADHSLGEVAEKVPRAGRPQRAVACAAASRAAARSRTGAGADEKCSEHRGRVWRACSGRREPCAGIEQ